MEDKHHLKESRTTHSVVQDAPLEKYDHHHKRAFLLAGVVMSMIIVLGLYAASFRYRTLVPEDANDLSRWGVMQAEFLDDSKSVFEGFKDITGAVTGVLDANKVRAKSIDILKDKLGEPASGTDSTATATSTSEIEDVIENAPTEN